MLKHKSFISIVWIAVLNFWILSSSAEMIVDTAWVRRYDGPAMSRDWPRAMTIDASGRIYVTGESYHSTTFDDYATIKYHPNGDTSWVRRYNGTGNSGDRAYAIAVDASGNVYVTGESYGGASGFDYLTIKYEPSGDAAWTRRYDGTGGENDAARAIAVDDSGYVYVTGWSYGNGTYSDFATVKYHPDGDTVWIRRYDGSGNGGDWACAMALDGSGNLYVTGQSYGGSTTYLDYATIKYHPNGDTAWVRKYNGTGSDADAPYDIAIDYLGNVYVTGESIGSGIEPDYLTIKYDADGNTIWSARYDGPAQWWDGAYAVAVDSFGTVSVTGGSFWSWVDADYTTIKYLRNGDTSWVRRYYGFPTGGDWAEDVIFHNDGNIYVTGCSFSGTDLDFATIKYDSKGDSVWVRRYTGPENQDDYAAAMAIDRLGNIYVIGSSMGSGSDYDYVTIKYYQALRGDANGDGSIDPGDVVYLIGFLFRNGMAPDPWLSGDANSDGMVDPADIVYLISYLFREGPPPGGSQR